MTGFAGLAPCVHCGFCLQACPTFLATGDEADSPRGRIVLMRALERGDLPADDPALVEHLDRCLGCRACEPVCPSGVRYGSALEAARERVASARPLAPVARAVLACMAMPSLRRALLALTRVARPLARFAAGEGRLGFLAGMLAATKPWKVRREGRQKREGPESTSGAPPTSPAPPAAVFSGCIQSGLFAHVNAAAERTLAANGHGVRRVAGQGCCGALHAHAGLLSEARALARGNVIAFAAAPEARVVVTAAGCGAQLKHYGELLAGDPLEATARAFAARVFDVTELLAERGPRPGGRLPLRVAYDAPCHLLHAQRVVEAPLAVLAAVPGVEVVSHQDAEQCCGSAGIYSLLEPVLSRAVLRRKVAALLAADPALVTTGNPGCAMQIGAGLAAWGRPLAVVHPVELLDASYAAAGFYRRIAEAPGSS